MISPMMVHGRFEQDIKKKIYAVNKLPDFSFVS